MAKAATHLMFASGAEEALNFYVSLFTDSEITSLVRYGANEIGADGTLKRADAVLRGHNLIFIDSPVQHAFTFTPAVSLYVECASEAELEHVFAQLSAGGQIYMPLGDYGFSRRFGWMSDRFGVSWQLNCE